MNNLTQNHIKWISTFTEEQFDTIVYKYLEDVLGITEFVDTDGPNDGGNDIRIFVKGEKLKVGFQVTIQEKNIERKIIQDVEKTQENVDKYGYDKRLFFFYSKTITEEKANELALTAEAEYDITLQLIDARKIAFAASKYPQLLKEINKQFGIEYEESRSFTEKDRMLYDFYSFGSTAAEIKSQIIKSFIVHKLYTSAITSVNEVYDQFSKHFETNDKNLFNRSVEQLITEKKIYREKESLRLSKYEERRIDVLKEQFAFQEHEFYSKLKLVLSKFSIDHKHIPAIIENLKKLFECNFSADKLDVLDRLADVESDPVSESVAHFFRYLRVISNENKAKYLIKEIINICNSNDIIQKLTAGKIFTSFANPEVIRNYINQTERLVFLDTPVILYVLCFYCYDIDHYNYYYDSVKDLLRLKDQNKSLSFKVNKNYLSEVLSHLREALMLVDFDRIGMISDLGGTNNVFYNFYKFLKFNEALEDGIDDFESFILSCFELSPNDIGSNFFAEKVNAQIKQSLMSFDIQLFERSSQKGLFELALESMEDALNDKDRFRVRDSIYNDASMLVTLFNDSICVNEPILVTWDLFLLSARKKYHQKIPASRLWHWFTPDRFNNHFSLLNFNLNSETITRDILSVIDDRFNFYKKAQTLLDAVSKLVNLKTETGRKYATAIKEFRKNYVYEIDVRKRPIEYIEIETTKYPVEELMFLLVKYYHQKREGYSLEDFKLIFQTDEIYDDVISYFKSELAYFSEHKKESEDAFQRMDGLVERAKQIQLKKLSS